MHASVGLCRPGYNLVDPEVLFFWVDFRHPAVFLGAFHPLRFFACGFFQLLFLGAWPGEATAKEAVEPAKNSRPVMSAIMTSNVLGIVVPFP